MNLNSFGSYLNSPGWIKNKKAAINICNIYFTFVISQLIKNGFKL